MLSPTVAPDANTAVSLRAVADLFSFRPATLVANTYDGSLHLLVGGKSDAPKPGDWEQVLATREATQQLRDAGWSDGDIAEMLSRNLADLIARR